MIIGIVGDTHNNLNNISKICEIFNEEQAELVLHTGDITLPKSLKAFEKLNCKLIGVFGNNDIEEKIQLLEVADILKFELKKEPFFIKLNDISICILHHPELIDKNLLDKSDFIFHGHTHRYRNEKIKDTLIFNPGECAGIISGKNKIGLLDLSNPIPKVISF